MIAGRTMFMVGEVKRKMFEPRETRPRLFPAVTIARNSVVTGCVVTVSVGPVAPGMSSEKPSGSGSTTFGKHYCHW